MKIIKTEYLKQFCPECVFKASSIQFHKKFLLGALLQLSTLLRRSENYLEWQTIRYRITNPAACPLYVGRCVIFTACLAPFALLLHIFLWTTLIETDCEFSALV